MTLPAPEQFQRKPPSQMNVTKFNPVYIQYKLDGVSLICCYHPSFDEPENVLVYTRNRLKAKGFLNIRKEFKRMFSDCPGLFTVGEVYTHGMQFNDITSVHRKNVYGTEMKCDVDYNIFDCFYTDLDLEKKTFEPNDIIGNYNSLINQLNSNHLTKIDVDKTVELYEEFIPKYSKYIKDMENFSASCSMSNILFTGRQNLLDKLIKPSDIIKKVDTLKATSSKDIEYYYIGAIEEKYEGLILRKDSEYRYSFEKEKRNPNCYKYKPFDDAEFEIIGYKFGEGAETKMIIFEFKCSDEYEGIKPGTFNATMNITQEEASKLYNELKDDPFKYNGKKITVSFNGVTDLGMPRNPRGIKFA